MTSKVSTAHFSNSIRHLSFKSIVLCCTWFVFLPTSDLLTLWDSDFLQHLLLWCALFTLATSNSCSGWCLLGEQSWMLCFAWSWMQKGIHHSFMNGKFYLCAKELSKNLMMQVWRCLVRFEEILGNLTSVCVFLGSCRTWSWVVNFLSKSCYALSEKALSVMCVLCCVLSSLPSWISLFRAAFYL